MKNISLAVMLAASPAAAQTVTRAHLSGANAISALGASFDGARFEAAPLRIPALSAPTLAATPTPTLVRPAPSSPEALAASARPAALSPESANEFSRIPAWLDASLLKFDALMKSSGGGGIAILRYGWRSQYEMSVFAFPGSPSISFREYSADPMGRPKRSFDATLETAPARRAAAAILRAAQERQPVSGKDKAALDDILAFLDGKENATVDFYSRLILGLIEETPRGGLEMSALRPGGNQSMVIRWHADTGFDFIRSDGFYYYPSQNHLRGVRSSLLKAMRESAPTSLQRRLLEKLDAAITPYE